VSKKIFDTRAVLATPSGYIIYDDGDVILVHDCYHWSFNHYWDLYTHFNRVTRETQHRKKIRQAINERENRGSKERRSLQEDSGTANV
jgi:hypothetical protein